MVKNIRAFKDIFVQLNYILSADQKKTSFVVFICVVVGSILELLGVSAIYPFLQIMLNPEKLKNEWYIKWIYSFAPLITNTEVLLLVGISIASVYLIKNCFMILVAYVENTYAAKIQREISVEMLDSYLKRPYEFFLNINSSIIIRGIFSDIDGVKRILLDIFSMLTEMLTIIALGVFLFSAEWTIASGAMILAGICFLSIVMGFKGKMKRAGQDVRESYVLKYQYGYQAIAGIKEISVLNRRKNFVRQYNKAAILEQRAMSLNGFISSCPDRILEGVCISGFMGIVCVKIAMGVDMNSFIPVLGTFAMGAFRILPSISKLSSRVNSIIFLIPALQNTYDNLKEVDEYEASLEKDRMCLTEERKPVRFHDELKLKDIKWRYRNATESVLQDASLSIRKGESVAFIGSSGAGKTTLADIIMGLLKPQSGEVKVDGTDIFTIPDQWCKMIGYVPQSVFLIDDTVRSNVAFGLEKDEISDDKVWAALEQAQLKEFVEKLPAGLDTIVGERGVKFSGGQRQRIAIARALYENPDILVLDEATSALDNETEHAVMESIDALQGMKTLIIVAHRLTTIRNCDRIYEIVDGIAIARSREEVFGGPEQDRA